jgi:hypothetical protein
MATRIVVAVMPTSEAGTVPVGAGDAEVAAVEAADDAAGDDDVELAADELLLLLELHPAASRTAAVSAPIRAATRVRPRTRPPVPPRPGPSLLCLIRVPSTTPLLARFARLCRAYMASTCIYRAVSKKTEAD